MLPFHSNERFKIHDLKGVDLSENDIDLFYEIKDFIKIIPTFETPKVFLEQYSLPSDLISLILVISKNDLIDKNVVDLGCGTGRFTIPIAKFFANRVFGVDSDLKTMNQIHKIVKKYDHNVDLLNTSIEFIETFNWNILFQTTIMNPPFGTKRRGIDQVFLRKALNYSDVVISIHKTSKKSRTLWKRIAKSYEKHIEILLTIDFPIERSFHFHQKESHNVKVDIIRFF